MNDSQGREEEWRNYYQSPKLEHKKTAPLLKIPWHYPLKSLLGEASMDTKSKSPNTKGVLVEKDNLTTKDTSVLHKIMSLIMTP
jgi:hypothetical protein